VLKRVVQRTVGAWRNDLCLKNSLKDLETGAFGSWKMRRHLPGKKGQRKPSRQNRIQANCEEWLLL
jgi:hypothetical protein